MFNRMKAVDFLLDCDIDTIINGGDFGIDHLEWILRNGFKGFEEMSDAELMKELETRGYELEAFFGEEVDLW
jgi:hypothetical protein